MAVSVSSERHWQSGVKEFAKVSKRPQQDSNPRPLDCQSHALTTEPPRPTFTSVKITTDRSMSAPTTDHFE